jgi:hypothetical protein
MSFQKKGILSRKRGNGVFEGCLDVREFDLFRIPLLRR